MRILMLLHKASFTKAQVVASQGAGNVVIDSTTLVEILQFTKQFLGPLGEREVMKLRMYSTRFPEMTESEMNQLGLWRVCSTNRGGTQQKQQSLLRLAWKNGVAEIHGVHQLLTRPHTRRSERRGLRKEQDGEQHLHHVHLSAVTRATRPHRTLVVMYAFTRSFSFATASVLPASSSDDTLRIISGCTSSLCSRTTPYSGRSSAKHANAL